MKIVNLAWLLLLAVLNVDFSIAAEDREDSETIKLVYGSLWPEGHFGRVIAQEFAEKVRKETSNKIIVEVTPPSADSELTEKVISGEIHMTSGHGLQDYVPEIALTYLPYLYNSFEHFREVWSMGKSLASDTLVNRTEQKLPQVKILGYSLVGCRDMILRKCSIRNEEDFKDLFVRVDGSKSSIETFKAFGSCPVSVEYHKVKESFKKDEIQAAENSPFNFIYMGWYEECNEISLTEHLMLLNIETVNTEFWGKLSSKYQEVILSAMQEATKKFSDTAYRKRTEALKQLGSEHGLSIREIDLPTKSRLKDKTQKMKEEFIKKYNLESEYEYIIGLGQKYILSE
jgi:TRAP-type C4-dicarboxylate transport system substrate-binding protein